MSTVAVIIPCYCDSKTLARALDSVYAQTKPVNEIIVVNDCSPQTTDIEKIIEIYPEVIYVKNSINMGLAASRNSGVAASASEILTFLDADDELHPQKIEFQLPFLAENSAITCRVQRVFWEESRCLAHIFDKAAQGDKFVGHGWWPFGNTLVGAALMIRRETFLRVGGYDSELRSCEDFDLWFRLISAGIEVYSLNCPLYFYYCNPRGLSRDFKNISHWEIIVLDKNLKPGLRRSLVFIFWLLKHFARVKFSGDSVLLDRAIGNSYKYVKPRVLASLCIFLGQIIPRFVVNKLLK